jgi:transcriptional regulator with XRE-family HTH domain
VSARDSATPGGSGRRDRAPRTGAALGARPGPADATEPAEERAWRDLLRAERLRLGLSQVQLGELVGVSPETIRKYEAGGRTPARTTLVRLVAALQLSAVQVRAILRGAGFAAADTMFPSDAYPNYYFSVAELRTYVEQVPWPQFVTNDLAQVVAANHAAEALWEIDFAAELARRSEAKLSLLSVAAERHFSERVVNWAECLTVLAGIFKGRPRDAIALEDPGAFVSEVLSAYAENDPAAIPQLVRAWESTLPAPGKVRWSYPITWREPGIGDIAFLSLVSIASEPDALSFNDWIPLDPASHARLAQVLAGRG